MANNKVVLSNGTTIMDISDTTAVASDVISGKYFYGADGVKTLGTATSSGGSTLTEHVIHLDFADGTEVDITTYYDDAFISSLITSTPPTEYGTKTINAASLDGTTWYVRPTETWETVLNNYVKYYPDDNVDHPYCWITELGETTIHEGSTWRVTFDGIEYRLTGFTQAGYDFGAIGNPKWGGYTDNGVDAPFYFYGPYFGAWSGSANVADDSSHMVKIERLVTA